MIAALLGLTHCTLLHSLNQLALLRSPVRIFDSAFLARPLEISCALDSLVSIRSAPCVSECCAALNAPSRALNDKPRQLVRPSTV